MATIAIQVTKNLIALVCDSTVIEKPFDSNRIDDMVTIEWKIRHLQRVEQYVAIIGDPLLADALDYLDWWEMKNHCFERDLTTKIGIANLLDCYSHLRRAIRNYWERQKNNCPSIANSIAVIVSKKSTEIVYFTPEGNDFLIQTKKRVLSEGDAVAINSIKEMDFLALQEENGDILQHLIDKINTLRDETLENKSLGRHDAYNRFAGVCIDRSSGIVVDRKKPFETMAEFIYGHVGGKNNWQFIRNGERWSPS